MFCECPPLNALMSLCGNVSTAWPHPRRGVNLQYTPVILTSNAINCGEYSDISYKCFVWPSVRSEEFVHCTCKLLCLKLYNSNSIPWLTVLMDTLSISQVIHQAPSPRFLGTHMHPDNIPESFTAKKTKVCTFNQNIDVVELTITMAFLQLFF